MKTSIQLTGFSTLLRLLVLVLTIEFTSSGFAQTFIPEYLDGLGYSAGWNYLKNRGQVYDLDGDPRSDVLFHSVGTVPSIYAMDAIRTAVTFAAYDSIDHQNDKVYRLDFFPTGEAVRVSVPFAYDPLPMKYNFYETYTPQGITGVTGSQRIIYPNIYSKVDYHILSDRYGPKFLYVVRPGGNPDDLLLQFEGQDSLDVDIDGMLKLYVGNKHYRLNQGMAYQQVGNTIVPVAWVPSYQNQHGSALVSFDFGAYDPTKPLIIQITPLNPAAFAPPPPPGPTPEWCTYVPGAGQEDFISDMTHDANGYVYYGGHSKSTSGLPPASGTVVQPNLFSNFDGIVGRFNEHYEVLTTQGAWLTYYGHYYDDQAVSVAYDGVNGRVAFCGHSFSASTELIDATTLPGCDTEEGFGMLGILNAITGQRIYGTRFPGNQYSLEPTDLDYDANGNLYVVGYAWMWYQGPWPFVDIPGNSDYYAFSYTQNGPGLLDGFVMRFNTGMERTWSIALGGPEDDEARTCKVDKDKNMLYVGGRTYTPNNTLYGDCPSNGLNDFPLCSLTGFYKDGINLSNSAGDCDGFVTKFRLADMHMIWSSYFGGGNTDVVTDMEVDDNSNLYLVGLTNSAIYSASSCSWSIGDGFPKCDNGQYFEPSLPNSGYDHFICRFNQNTVLTWSTKIQGSRDEAYGNSLARTKVSCDEFNNVFLQGSTLSGLVQTDAAPVDIQSNAGYYSAATHTDVGTTPLTHYDAYVAGWSVSGNLFYSTYFGGLGSEWTGGLDAFSGRVYVGGATESAQLIPTNAPSIPGHTPYLISSSSSGANVDGYFAQLAYDITIGVPETIGSTNGNLWVVPNPVDDECQLRLPAGEQVIRIQITDATGRSVQAPVLKDVGLCLIRTGALAPGVYVVTVQLNGGVRSTSFVKY